MKLAQRVSIGTLNAVEEASQRQLIGGKSQGPFRTVGALFDVPNRNFICFAVAICK
jgi:hypothetical protein